MAARRVRPLFPRARLDGQQKRALLHIGMSGRPVWVESAAKVEAELEQFRRNTGRAAPVLETGPVLAALGRMGDPQHRLPPVIHVTGTNGKGSTTAFIRSIAEAAGLRVHVFTSPHLQRVNERIRVAGDLVSDEALLDALVEVADRTEGLTYFEALTAAALWLFAENRADLAVVEVGAGGATDATNVFEAPLATIVTPIDRDHEGLFNVSGVAAIARIKAGIFRGGRPAVLAPQNPIARGVLLEEARRTNAEPYLSGRDWISKWDKDAFVFEGRRLQVRAPWLGLAGRHQAENAGAACAAIEQLSHHRLTPETLSAGLRGAVWPGRLQQLKQGPLHAGWDGEIVIDAAHNPAGARILAAEIRARNLLAAQAVSNPDWIGGRTSLVLAAQGSKDIAGMLAELAPAVDDIIACPLPDSGGQEGGAGAAPEDIAATCSALGVHAMMADDYRAALRLAKAAGARRIYVCGSVYLCGALLRANGEAVS